MAELIDREELRKFPIRIDHYDKENGSLDFVLGIETVFEYIEYLPTIEAKPVVHAHWQKYDDSEFCYCSYCGKPAAEDDDVSWHGYCPVCGAQMDEVIE